jgi:hypothetical protein
MSAFIHSGVGGLQRPVQVVWKLNVCIRKGKQAFRHLGRGGGSEFLTGVCSGPIQGYVQCGKSLGPLEGQGSACQDSFPQPRDSALTSDPTNI